MRTLRITAILAVLGLLAAVAACSAAQRERPTWRGTIRVSMARIARQAKVSKAQAEKIALDSVDAADKKLVGSELSTENDSLSYEVKVTAGGKTREILVDAGSGKVLKEGEQGSIQLGLARMARVDKAAAEKAALAAVQGADADKSIGDSELEVEHDFLIYEIDVKVKNQPGVTEVIVDAGTGKVLATEHESGEGEG
jgi:uncharacterized membrane protein YkoI